MLWAACLFLLSAFCIPATAQAQVVSGRITTVVGDGKQGFSGDDTIATSAQLASPKGVAVDTSGNLYIADSNNSVIRKVSSSGIITTVAGIGVTGSGGYSGDNGPATSAHLTGPTSVAVDASGNLYIADYYNHRIRKVSSTGIITTVAGNGLSGYSGDNGAAVSAQLSYPQAVAVDTTSNIYIADSGNHRIRKVNSSGIITTVAGNGTIGYTGDDGAATSAHLGTPVGVAVDVSGNLYLADAQYNVIRKVISSGIITTVAGSTFYNGLGDNGTATAAQLAYPVGIAVDTFGNLYIADSKNYFGLIRKVSTSGIITTVAGNGSCSIINNVQCYSGDNGPATSAELNQPTGVAVDGSGNLYIADTNNNRIRKVSYLVDSPTK
jgi:sugar lactone lactonase YvrE